LKDVEKTFTLDCNGEIVFLIFIKKPMNWPQRVKESFDEVYLLFKNCSAIT
jgi:hypothetical protein